MSEQQKSRQRGIALTIVLVLSVILATIAFVAASLLPYCAEGIDVQREMELAQSLADGALEESLANLRAGRSPECLRQISEQRLNGSAGVRELTELREPRRIELLAGCRFTSARLGRDGKQIQIRYAIRVTVSKDNSGIWRTNKYLIVKQE